VAKLWELINKRIQRDKESAFDDLTGSPCEKHLLWALHKLKVYSDECSMTTCLSTGKKKIDPKTFRKWSGAFIRELAALKDEVVSLIVKCFLKRKE